MYFFLFTEPYFPRVPLRYFLIPFESLRFPSLMFSMYRQPPASLSPQPRLLRHRSLAHCVTAVLRYNVCEPLQARCVPINHEPDCLLYDSISPVFSTLLLDVDTLPSSFTSMNYITPKSLECTSRDVMPSVYLCKMKKIPPYCQHMPVQNVYYFYCQLYSGYRKSQRTCSSRDSALCDTRVN